MSLIARKYLQILATSAPSEQYFSLSALIIHKLRNRLSKDMFLYIIALKSWGVFREEEEEDKIALLLEENQFFIDYIN